MPPVQYQAQIKNMNHLGLVAGMCKELGIADHIDQRAPKASDNWNVSHGEAIVGMILNGLRGHIFNLESCNKLGVFTIQDVTPRLQTFLFKTSLAIWDEL